MIDNKTDINHWKLIMDKCFKQDFTKDWLVYNVDTNQYNYIGAKYPKKILMIELATGFYREYYRIPYKRGVEVRTQYVGGDEDAGFVLNREEILRD